MIDTFLEALHSAFAEGRGIKATLSRPTALAGELKNVYIRFIEIKKGARLAFTYRYKTRDEVKNYTSEEAEAQLRRLLGEAFRQADLFTPAGDYALRFSKTGEAHLTSGPPSQTTPADTRHDRDKHRLLDTGAPWLHALGITSRQGQVLAASQDKWRQINKYLEIIESLLRAHPLSAEARIADMGSGKGYLTFALYDYLTNGLGMQPQIVGIELRPKLVEFCNELAAENGFSNLTFQAADIADFQTDHLDMLIALHACDTATDLALAKGLKAGAGILVAAPCCHKQVRRDMAPQNELAPLLRFGILKERQAEIVTDGIRALLLEANGYETKVFEFISTEHTAKNVMITALRTEHERSAQPALQQIEALKTAFGIQEHYLEKLLRTAD